MYMHNVMNAGHLETELFFKKNVSDQRGRGGGGGGGEGREERILRKN